MTTIEFLDLNPLVFTTQVSGGELTVKLIDDQSEELILCNSDRVAIKITVADESAGTLAINIVDDGNVETTVYSMGEDTPWARDRSARPYFSYRNVTIAGNNDPIAPLPIYVAVTGTTKVPKSQIILIKRRDPS